MTRPSLRKAVRADARHTGDVVAQRPVFIWDPERCRIVWSNSDAVAFWGAKSALNLAEREFSPEGPVANLFARHRVAAENGGAVCDFAMLPVNGEARAVRIEIERARLEDGRDGLLARIGVEPQALNQALRLAVVADRAPTPTALFRMDGALLAENHAADRLFGSRCDAAFDARVGASEAQTLTNGAFATGVSTRDCFAATRFGERRCRVTAVRAFDPASGAPAVLVAFDDQTERRHDQERRRFNEGAVDPFRAVVEAHPGAIVIAKRARILYANKAASALLALTPGAPPRPPDAVAAALADASRAEWRIELNGVAVRISRVALGDAPEDLDLVILTEQAERTKRTELTARSGRTAARAPGGAPRRLLHAAAAVAVAADDVEDDEADADRAGIHNDIDADSDIDAGETVPKNRAEESAKGARDATLAHAAIVKDIVAALGRLGVAALTLDRELRIGEINARARTLLDDAAAPGARLDALLAPVEEDGFAAALAKADDADAAPRVLARRVDPRRARDDDAWRETNDDALIDASITPLGDAGVYLAQLTRPTAEAEARRPAHAASGAKTMSRKLYARSAAAYNHEIRTALTTIRGFSELMETARHGPLGDWRYVGYVENILAATRRAHSLADGMIDLIRLEDGAIGFAEGPVDLGRLAWLAAADALGLADLRGVAIEMNLVEELPPIHAERNALARAIALIMTQAVESSARNDVVTVRGDRGDDGAVALIVEDDGAGAPEDAISAAFDPESVVAASGRNPLTVWIARPLVEAAGGTLSVEPREGGGHRVILSFPRASVAPPRE